MSTMRGGAAASGVKRHVTGIGGGHGDLGGRVAGLGHAHVKEPEGQELPGQWRFTERFPRPVGVHVVSDLDAWRQWVRSRD